MIYKIKVIRLDFQICRQGLVQRNEVCLNFLQGEDFSSRKV